MLLKAGQSSNRGYIGIMEKKMETTTYIIIGYILNNLHPKPYTFSLRYRLGLYWAYIIE